MWDYFITTLKEFWARKPRLTPQDAVWFIGTFLLIGGFNFLMIRFVSGSLDPETMAGSWRIYITAVPGTRLSVTGFWLVFTTLAVSLASSIKRNGIGRVIKDLGSSPRWISWCIKNSEGMWALAILAGAALALLSGLVIKNMLTLITLALLIFVSIIKSTNGFFYIFTLLLLGDIQKMRGSEKKLNLGAAGLVTLGLLLGLLIYLATPLKPWGPLLLAAILAVSALLLKLRKISPSSAATIAIFVFVSLVAFRFSGVLAWDGSGDYIGPSDPPPAGKAATASAVTSFFASIYAGIVRHICGAYYTKKDIGATDFTPAGAADHDGWL